MKRLQTALKLIGFAAGCTLFVWVVRQSNVSEIVRLWQSMPLWAAAVPLLYAGVCVWDVWGWKVIVDAACGIRSRMMPLFTIRLVGAAFNEITPFADIGGEYVKAKMCSRDLGVPERAAWSTVIVERTALFVSELLFWLVGLVPFLFFLPGDEGLKKALVIAVSAAAGIVMLLLVAQRSGVFNFVVPEIRIFYQQHHGPWFVSVFLHGVGWLAGGVEMYCMMKALDPAVTFGHAMVLESLLHLVRTASFFIPGSLGAQEGALALIVTSLGYPASLGVGVSLFKRARQLLWMGIGFGLWVKKRR